jgi:hypothetical protein
MKRDIIGCLIGFVVIVAIPLTLFNLEYKRESDVCLSANSSVKNAQEAKNAVRNYRGAIGYPDMMSKLHQNELFQSDGFGVNGGWSVQEWTRLIAVHGYTVSFELRDPEFEIVCDVFECGAVVANCMTLGTYVLLGGRPTPRPLP